MSKILLGVIVEAISTRQDNSFKLVVGTSEIDRNQVSDLFDLRNKYCKMFITDNNISPVEEKLIDETKLQDGKRVKTKSQRMRAVIYRIWEHSQSELDFETFYNNRMDKEIDGMKAEIPTL